MLEFCGIALSLETLRWTVYRTVLLVVLVLCSYSSRDLGGWDNSGVCCISLWGLGSSDLIDGSIGPNLLIFASMVLFVLSAWLELLSIEDAIYYLSAMRPVPMSDTVLFIEIGPSWSSPMILEALGRGKDLLTLRFALLFIFYASKTSLNIFTSCLIACAMECKRGLVFFVLFCPKAKFYIMFFVGLARTKDYVP